MKAERPRLGYPKPPVDGKFKPIAHYDSDGDCIEVIAVCESFYREWPEPLTIYRSQKTGEIVGFFLENVSKLLNPSEKSGDS